jgi:hypothetical protein
MLYGCLNLLLDWWKGTACLEVGPQIGFARETLGEPSTSSCGNEVTTSGGPGGIIQGLIRGPSPYPSTLSLGQSRAPDGYSWSLDNRRGRSTNRGVTCARLLDRCTNRGTACIFGPQTGGLLVNRCVRVVGTACTFRLPIGGATYPGRRKHLTDVIKPPGLRAFKWESRPATGMPNGVLPAARLLDRCAQ